MTKSTNQQKATVAKDILWDERQFHSGIEDRLCQDQFVQEQVIKNLKIEQLPRKGSNTEVK